MDLFSASRYKFDTDLWQFGALNSALVLCSIFVALKYFLYCQNCRTSRNWTTDMSVIWILQWKFLGHIQKCLLFWSTCVSIKLFNKTKNGAMTMRSRTLRSRPFKRHWGPRYWGPGPYMCIGLMGTYLWLPYHHPTRCSPHWSTFLNPHPL